MRRPSFILLALVVSFSLLPLRSYADTYPSSVPSSAPPPPVTPTSAPTAGAPTGAPDSAATPADTGPAVNNPPTSTSSVDQQDNNFYWQGTQLYNLGRLGEAFDSFEKAIQRKQNSKEAQAYLLQIRQEIVNNAKSRENERKTVDAGKNTPDAALSVVYVEPGYVRVTLHAKFLFDENTASLKVGAIDVLNHLSDILNSKDGNRVELTFEDELDQTIQSPNIDAARALVVFALLNFKHLADVENNG